MRPQRGETPRQRLGGDAGRGAILYGLKLTGCEGSVDTRARSGQDALSFSDSEQRLRPAEGGEQREGLRQSGCAYGRNYAIVSNEAAAIVFTEATRWDRHPCPPY
jgi:hypothetical protein